MNRRSFAVVGTAVVQLAFAGGPATAQNAGISFEERLTWHEVRTKAERENKFIFLVWPAPKCADCLERGRQLYSQAQVGSFFNDKFISVIVPLDSVEVDRTLAASWSDAARVLRQQYNLPAVPPVPMLLFFSPDGRAVHRAWGGGTDASELLALASDALNPQRQYYSLLEHYRRGKRDPAVMRYLARAARALDDRDLAAAVAEDYIRGMAENDLLTQANIRFMAPFTERSSNGGFAFFLQHADRINQVMDSAGYAERVIDGVISREDVRPKLRSVFIDPRPDWGPITNEIGRKYGNVIAERVIEAARRSRSVELSLLEAPQLNVEGLNVLAWITFQRSTDHEELRAASEWVKRALEQEGNAAPAHVIDTYANLLYKIGDVDEAIKWQEKALAAEPNPFREALRDNLEKMRKGQPTW